MSEENKVEEVVTKNDVNTSQEESAESGFTEIELKAMEHGWKPKSEFKEDTKEFIGAEEYMRRGPLIKEIMSRNKEIKEMKDTLKKLSDHMTKSEEAAFKRGMEAISTQRDNAILSGDLAQVKDLDQRIDAMKQQIQNTSMTNSTLSQEEQEFVSKHSSWFNDKPENREITEAAVFFDQYLLKTRADLSRPEQLVLVEQRVKKLFPDKFSNPRQSAPTTVGTSTTNRDSNKSSLASRMTSQQRALAEQFVSNIPGYTLERYAKELDKQGNLGK